MILGREYWRLAGVSPITNYGLSLADQSHVYGLLSRAGKLVTRLVQGEESNPELFDEFKNACNFLNAQSLDDEATQYFETLFIVRILSHLGYWADQKEMPWLVDADLSQEILLQTADNQRNLIERINTSLRETQL